MKFYIILTTFIFLTGCSGESADKQSETPVSDSVSFIDKPLQGKVNRRGLYRMVRSGGVVDDDKTTTGKVIANPVIQLVESTERIPLVIGAQMYLQYKLWSFPNSPAYVDLRRVLIHPDMKLPDGYVSTGSDFAVKRKVSSNHIIVYTGYGFDEDYELVEGEWTFQIWYKDKKLIEQKFTTYWPDEKELAALKPKLELGNNVLTKMRSPNNPNPKLNWPRVMAGNDKSRLPEGVKETINSMAKPIVTQ